MLISPGGDRGAVKARHLRDMDWGRRFFISPAIIMSVELWLAAGELSKGKRALFSGEAAPPPAPAPAIGSDVPWKLFLACYSATGCVCVWTLKHEKSTIFFAQISEHSSLSVGGEGAIWFGSRVGIWSQEDWLLDALFAWCIYGRRTNGSLEFRSMTVQYHMPQAARLLYRVQRYWWNYYSKNVGTKSFRAWLHRYHKVTTLDRLINLLILCHALQLAVLQHRWFETEDLQQDILVCCQFSVTWRNDWECVSSAHWTDGGSSSPLLRDLIWMEWLRGHRRARGTIRLAHELSARSIGRYYWGPKRALLQNSTTMIVRH